MSSISSILATNNSSQAANLSNFAQEFTAIGSALQTGDLPTAQSALTTFQQYLQGTAPASTSQPFGANSAANTDFQGLVDSLTSGDLSAARQAFGSLQQDIKSLQQGQVNHHRMNSGWIISPNNSTTVAAGSNATSSLNQTA